MDYTYLAWKEDYFECNTPGAIVLPRLLAPVCRHSSAHSNCWDIEGTTCRYRGEMGNVLNVIITFL